MRVIRWVLVSIAVLMAIGVIVRFISGDRELMAEPGPERPKLEEVA
jgi:hypothetical protein